MTKLILILLTLSNAVLIADCIITHAELKAVKNGVCELPKGYVAKPIVERLEIKKKQETFNPQKVSFSLYLPPLPAKELRK